MECLKCHRISTVGNAIPDIDGEGSLGCPFCYDKDLERVALVEQPPSDSEQGESKCETCNGTGKIDHFQEELSGKKVNRGRPCPDCRPSDSEQGEFRKTHFDEIKANAYGMETPQFCGWLHTVIYDSYAEIDRLTAKNEKLRNGICKDGCVYLEVDKKAINHHIEVRQQQQQRIQQLERQLMEDSRWPAEEKELRQKIQQLEGEKVKMQQWVNDLQSEMYINCVYCGHRYGPKKNTPVAMADVLKKHIEKCPKHPMSELKTKYKQLEAELEQAKTEKPND